MNIFQRNGSHHVKWGIITYQGKSGLVLMLPSFSKTFDIDIELFDNGSNELLLILGFVVNINFLNG